MKKLYRLLHPFQAMNLTLDSEKKKSETLLSLEQEKNQALSEKIAQLESAAKQREAELLKQNAEMNSRFEGLLDKALGRVTDLESKMKQKETDAENSSNNQSSKAQKTKCPVSPDADESSDSDDDDDAAGITTPNGKTATWTQLG